MAKTELGTMKNGRLRGRFMWLLEEMCKKCDVDTELIDPTLTYDENKQEIQKEAHKKLFLKPAKREPEEEEKEIGRIVRAYQDSKDAEAERVFDECVEILKDAIKKARKQRA